MSKTFPFIIMNRAGEVVVVLQTDEKGFKKSLEHGTVWHLHGETGRLLPWDCGEGRPLCRELRMKEDWAEAVLEGYGPESDKNSFTAEKRGIGPGQTEAGKERSGNDLSDSAGKPDKVSSSIIDAIAAIVSERKKSMPEGSYTSHLFSSGGAKIRKKLGEEAVELVLAESRDEMIHESADLIYHLLVFLENEEIPPGEVFRELEKRMG